MKTLKDAIEAKRQLERDILALVREFEVEYDLSVDNVELLKTQTMGGSNQTVSVRIEVYV